MSDRSRNRAPVRLSIQHLRYAAGALALLVAGLHLFHPQHGLERFVAILGSDPSLFLAHPRPVAFVLSAVAIVVGVYLCIFGVARRPIYALGIALMLAYVVGYFAWHFTGHGGFLPGREPYYHGMGPLETVVAHLRGDRWAATAVAAELLLAAILAALYRRDSP